MHAFPQHAHCMHHRFPFRVLLPYQVAHWDGRRETWLDSYNKLVVLTDTIRKECTHLAEAFTQVRAGRRAKNGGGGILRNQSESFDTALPTSRPPHWSAGIDSLGGVYPSGAAAMPPLLADEGMGTDALPRSLGRGAQPDTWLPLVCECVPILTFLLGLVGFATASSKPIPFALLPAGVRPPSCVLVGIAHPITHAPLIVSRSSHVCRHGPTGCRPHGANDQGRGRQRQRGNQHQPGDWPATEWKPAAARQC